MKIVKTTAYTLRVPYEFPLIAAKQHALVTFVERSRVEDITAKAQPEAAPSPAAP